MSGVELETDAVEEPTGGDVETREAAASGPLVLDRSAGLAPIVAGWGAEPVVLDWFGPGRADLLVGAGGGPSGRSARVFGQVPAEGDRPARFDAGRPVAGLDGLRAFCPLPSDGPGRFDLVALADEGLVWLPNEGEATDPKFGARHALGLGPDLGIGPGRVAQMVADDWDGDGLTDLLVGFDDLEGYWPEGDAVPVEQQVGFNQRGGHPGYDRSGHWRGRPPRGRLFWLRNEGSKGQPRFSRAEEIEAESGALDLAGRPAPLAVTWAGSRSWELLLADARGQVRLFRNFGGQRPPVLMEPRLLQQGGRPFALPPDRTAIVAADLDGDRRLELVFGAEDGRVFAVHAAPGRDEVSAPAALLTDDRTLRLGGPAVVAAGDLDGDGDIDLIVGDGPGRLSMVEDLGGPGDHRYAIPAVLESGGLPFRLDPGPDGMLGGPAGSRLGHACPALGDWHDSGRLDLIVGGAGGEVLYLRNNGAANSPRFDRPVPLRCEGAPLITPPRVRPAVADWTGQGEPELITLDLQGILCVHARTKAGEVAAPVPIVDRLGRLIRLDGGFGRSGLCALWAGPWTGSGRVDLLVGLPRGSRFVVPALTGRPLTSLDDLPTVLLLENVGKGVVVPRPIRLADGPPLALGSEGCSPCGADWSGRGSLDLIIGSDDGLVRHFRRDDLRW